ncbi:MAG TPA: hypothetical protein VN843_07245 [Anaerolineales bacterium]|nr:hypothetical protein [Anaerolineales bacterium]
MLEGTTDGSVDVVSKPDYYIPITRGQYWVKNSRVIAFVLEVNDYAVIYQKQVSLSDHDDVVFDFNAGQEILTIQSFREMLEKSDACIFNVNPSLVDLSLKVYRKKIADREILNFKTLPRNEDEARDLSDIENYKVKKMIIPPPFRYRKKKTLHWLKAGVSGEFMVCKLWDPEIDNWVLPNGKMDRTALIGYVNGYLSIAQTEFPGNDKETFDELISRIIDFLRQKNMLFDERYVRKSIKQLDPSFLFPFISREHLDGVLDKDVYILPCEDTNPKGHKDEVRFPVYDLIFEMVTDRHESSNKESDKLYIKLLLDKTVLYALEFLNIQNMVFIPNGTIYLRSY